MGNIERWIYEPTSWARASGFTANSDKCRHRILTDSGFGAYQCQRKPTRTIQGYGFCTQHAKMIERRLSDE